MNSIQDLNASGSTPVEFDTFRDYEIVFGNNAGNISSEKFEGNFFRLDKQTPLNSITNQINDLIINVQFSNVAAISNVLYLGNIDRIKVSQATANSWQVSGIVGVAGYDAAFNDVVVLTNNGVLGNTVLSTNVSDQLGNVRSWNNSITFIENIFANVESQLYFYNNDGAVIDIQIVDTASPDTDFYTVTIEVENASLGSISYQGVLSTSHTIVDTKQNINASFNNKEWKCVPTPGSTTTFIINYTQIRNAGPVLPQLLQLDKLPIFSNFSTMFATENLDILRYDLNSTTNITDPALYPVITDTVFSNTEIYTATVTTDKPIGNIVLGTTSNVAITKTFAQVNSVGVLTLTGSKSNVNAHLASVTILSDVTAEIGLLTWAVTNPRGTQVAFTQEYLDAYAPVVQLVDSEFADITVTPSFMRREHHIASNPKFLVVGRAIAGRTLDHIDVANSQLVISAAPGEPCGDFGTITFTLAQEGANASVLLPKPSNSTPFKTYDILNTVLTTKTVYGTQTQLSFTGTNLDTSIAGSSATLQETAIDAGMWWTDDTVIPAAGSYQFKQPNNSVGTGSQMDSITQINPVPVYSISSPAGRGVQTARFSFFHKSSHSVGAGNIERSIALTDKNERSVVRILIKQITLSNGDSWHYQTGISGAWESGFAAPNNRRTVAFSLYADQLPNGPTIATDSAIGNFIIANGTPLIFPLPPCVGFSYGGTSLTQQQRISQLGSGIIRNPYYLAPASGLSGTQFNRYSKNGVFEQELVLGQQGAVDDLTGSLFWGRTNPSATPSNLPGKGLKYRPVRPGNLIGTAPNQTREPGGPGVFAGPDSGDPAELRDPIGEPKPYFIAITNDLASPQGLIPSDYPVHVTGGVNQPDYAIELEISSGFYNGDAYIDPAFGGTGVFVPANTFTVVVEFAQAPQP